MKKFLLSLAVLACGVSFSNAATTLSMADYTDVKGTHYEKELKEDGTTKTNERYQPLESLKVGNYTMTFSYTPGEKVTAPALYLASTVTVRLYNTSTMTITAPAGETMGSIKFNCDGLKNDPSATATEGTVSFANGGLVWNGTPANSVTISFAGTVKIKGLEISAETGSDPVLPPATGGDATTLEVSKYENVAGTHCEKELNEDGTTKTNERYQPLESFTISDYKFAFSYVEGEKVTAPALYIANKITARVYNNSSMTITAPAGMYMGQITIICDGLSKDPATTSPEGTVKYADGKLIWTGESANEVTFNFGGTVKMTAFEIAKEAGDTPNPPTPSDPTVVYSGLTDNAEGWTFDNTVLPEGLSYVWKWDSTNSYLKGSAYFKQVYAAEAYAISPVIDLTDRTSATLSFQNIFNQYKLNNDMINVSDFNGYAYVMIKEEGANSWTDLNALTAPTEFSWNFYDNEPINLNAYVGKKVQIAFKYVSTADVAGTWEVKNFVVKGENANAIEGVDAEEGVAEYFDFNGRRVNADNLQKGMYIVRRGAKVSKVVIK